MGIFNKLLNIQKKINGLSKDQKSFQYKYVTGNKVLGHIKPIMNDEGILLKQEILTTEYERMTYSQPGKWNSTTKKFDDPKEKNEVLYLCKFKFTWIDCESGEKDENIFFASGMNDWEKGMGSAMTYAERYFILKFFHIATDEDDVDNDSRKKEEPRMNTSKRQTPKTPYKATTAKPAPATETPKNQIQAKQLQRINILISELGINTKDPIQKEKIYGWLGIKSLKTISEIHADNIIKKLTDAKTMKKGGK